MKQTEEYNPALWTYIQSFQSGENLLKHEEAKMRSIIITSDPSKTKMHTYITLNPNLEAHPIYSSCPNNVPDFLRINFSRFRLLSHRLKVELGRWNGVPHENRHCECKGGIQDEDHIFSCSLVASIFSKYGKEHYASPNDLFHNTDSADLEILYEILQWYLTDIDPRNHT